METWERILKQKCPSIMRICKRGGHVVIVLPEVTDAVEDMIFGMIGVKAVVITPEAYNEIKEVQRDRESSSRINSARVSRG